MMTLSAIEGVREKLILYTDGGKKQGVVGWAFVVLRKGQIVAKQSGSATGKSAYSEFLALIEGLRYLTNKGMFADVVHRTDSTHLFQVMNGLKKVRKLYELATVEQAVAYLALGGTVSTEHVSRNHSYIQLCDKEARKIYDASLRKAVGLK